MLEATLLAHSNNAELLFQRSAPFRLAQLSFLPLSILCHDQFVIGDRDPSLCRRQGAHTLPGEWRLGRSLMVTTHGSKFFQPPRLQRRTNIPVSKSASAVDALNVEGIFLFCNAKSCRPAATAQFRSQAVADRERTPQIPHPPATALPDRPAAPGGQTPAHRFRLREARGPRAASP